MEKKTTYHEQTSIDNTVKLREVLATLPDFCRNYFRAMEPKSSARTRINYAYDIRVFFHFLMENNPVYKNYMIYGFFFIFYVHKILISINMIPSLRLPYLILKI